MKYFQNYVFHWMNANNYLSILINLYNLETKPTGFYEVNLGFPFSTAWAPLLWVLLFGILLYLSKLLHVLLCQFAKTFFEFGMWCNTVANVTIHQSHCRFGFWLQIEICWRWLFSFFGGWSGCSFLVQIWKVVSSLLVEWLALLVPFY